MIPPKTARELAALLDHTLLRPDSTEADVARLVEEGLALGVHTVFVPPTLVRAARRFIAGGPCLVGTTAGFPTGSRASALKRVEAERALEAGAQEIDMVARVDLARAGEWARWRADVAAVGEAVRAAGANFKVIVEAEALADEEVRRAAVAAVDGGAVHVKTSTGFHPAGGATVRAVRIIAEAVGGRAGVKASGGVRTAAQCRALLEAGATRIGTSASAAILADWDRP